MEDLESISWQSKTNTNALEKRAVLGNRTVFRMERKSIGKNGEEGLYSALAYEFNQKYLSLIRKHNCACYPDLNDDYHLFINQDDGYKFACQSFCNLLYWFGDYLPELAKDFNIFAYEVTKIYVGDSGVQCIFNLSDVTSKKLLYGNIAKTRLIDKTGKGRNEKKAYPADIVFQI